MAWEDALGMDIETGASTFGEIAEATEPSGANGEKSTFDKEMGAWKEVREKVKALSDEQNKSIAEFEALLARIRGEDTVATEEEVAALAKQQTDAWANLLSQEQGLLNQTVSVREPPWGFKSWRVGQTSDEEIAAILAKASEDTVATKSESVSPSMARTRMPDPIAPLGPYSTRKAFPSPLESSVPFVSDYQDAGMPNVGLPIDYAGIPTQGDPRFMTDVGARSSTVLGEVIASTGHPDWGMSSTPMNPPRMVTRPDGTVEMMEMPIMQSQVPLIDVPKDIKTTKKDTKKTNYGAWKGKFNNLTSKQNLKNLHTFQKARMSDFEKRFGSAKYFGLTRPTVNGKPIEWSENALRNKYMRTDQFSNDYNAVYGTSKVAKLVGGGLSKGVSLVGGGLQGFFNKKGVGNADTFDDVIRKVEAGEYEGQAEVPAPDPRDKVTGGFWGLMAFAKKHPKIFGPLSGDELWSLISDPDGFWEYYEAALEGD